MVPFYLHICPRRIFNEQFCTSLWYRVRISLYMVSLFSCLGHCIIIWCVSSTTKLTLCMYKHSSIKRLSFKSTVVTFNPSNAKATFIQSTRAQQFLTNIKTLSCRYSLDSSRRELSDEYPFPRGSVIFRVFSSFRIGQIKQQQQKG